jgi:CheY-like chemotaxis protein
MEKLPLRVLIVENTPERQEILQSLYQDHGWVIAPTAARAIRLLETYYFDLVSLDFNLTGVEQGEDLASFISRFLNGKTKVIVHSSKRKETDPISAQIPQADIVPLSRITRSHAVLERFRQELSRGNNIDWIFVFTGKIPKRLKEGNLFLSMITRVFNLILIILFCVFIGSTIGLHWGLNVCPFHLATFESSEVIPVVYGDPSPEDLMKALYGEIILGGDKTHSLSGLCPYCYWPARFTLFHSEEVALDELDEEDQEDEEDQDEEDDPFIGEPEEIDKRQYLEAGIRVSH